MSEMKMEALAVREGAASPFLDTALAGWHAVYPGPCVSDTNFSPNPSEKTTVSKYTPGPRVCRAVVGGVGQWGRGAPKGSACSGQMGSRNHVHVTDEHDSGSHSEALP